MLTQAVTQSALMTVGVVNNTRNSPFYFASIFSTISLNIYPVSNIVLVWNLWSTCVIQGIKCRPQLLVVDLERLQWSHKILVSLKSHSEGIKRWGQGSSFPMQDLKRGQVKMVGEYSRCRTEPGEGAPPSQHQSPYYQG